MFDGEKYLNSADAPPRPADWPVNDIERILDDAIDAVRSFRNGFCSDRNELIRRIRLVDINELAGLGVIRITRYTSFIINGLYFLGKQIASPMTMALCYRIVRMLVLTDRAYRIVREGTGIETVDEYYSPDWMDSLIPQLRYFKLIYESYRYDNTEKSFAELISEDIDEIIKLKDKGRAQEGSCYASSICDFVYDSSFIAPCIDLPFIDFDREEAESLIHSVSNLINAYPGLYKIKGLFHILLPNLLMKSRPEAGSYDDVLYKYMRPDLSAKAMENGELWCNEIHSMNDCREGITIRDIIDDTSWYSPSWRKRIESIENYPHSWRTYYSASFTRRKSGSEMHERYGSDCYGYKGSLITELIAPVVNKPGIGVQFSQTMVFDITYDRDVVKKELSLVMAFIDSLPLTEGEKRVEWVEYLQYWIFSVKDEEWKDEAERRFCFFLFPDTRYKYADRIDDADRRLKVRCPVYIEPDFVVPGHSQYEHLRMLRDKRVKDDKRSFAYCSHCLGLDYNKRELGKRKDGTASCRFCGGEAELKGFER